MADIWKSHGEVLRAVGLWKAARPLFTRSSQARDVVRIDAKLATVKAEILECYEGQPPQLAELDVPGADLGKGRDSAYEEEDQKLVDGEQKGLHITV
jgi:hypothetical protein